MVVLIGVPCVFAVMRRNPFVVDGCCRKGSPNALQELYNPTEVSPLAAEALRASVGCRSDGGLALWWARPRPRSLSDL